MEGEKPEQEQEKLSPLVLRQLLKSKNGDVRAAALITLITMKDDPIMPDPKELEVGDGPTGCQGFAAAFPSLRDSGFSPSSLKEAVRIRMGQAI